MSSKRKRQRPRSARTQRRRAAAAETGQRGLKAWILPGFLGVAVIAIALLGISAIAGDDRGTVTAEPAPPPVLGEQTARVVIHEYADYLCPFCGRFARTIKPELQERYIDTGLVQLVWHDLAGHGQPSWDTANAARCAGDQGHYWDYHDFLYAIQQGAGHDAYSDERLKEYGDAMGLEPDAFHACVDAGTYEGAIEADMRSNRRQGITGTPSFVIGDQRIVGAQPVEVFEQAILRELQGG